MPAQKIALSNSPSPYELWAIAPIGLEAHDAAYTALIGDIKQTIGSPRKQQSNGHILYRAPMSEPISPIECRNLADASPFDVGCVRQAAAPALCVFDMDSTLITMEVIDELAKEAGAGEAVALITEAAMRGELDFNASLTKRVATLSGMSQDIIERVKKRLCFNPGVEAFAQRAKQQGIFLAVVSGGFVPMAEHVKARLEFDYARANTLEIIDGVLSGKVLGEIVNASVKAHTLKELTIRQQASTVWAIGDGANDADMLAAANVGIAFRAKPKLRATADLALDKCDMRVLNTLIESLTVNLR